MVNARCSCSGYKWKLEVVMIDEAHCCRLSTDLLTCLLLLASVREEGVVVGGGARTHDE